MKPSHLKLIKQLNNHNDLPSLSQAIKHHLGLLQLPQLKNKAKYFLTTDQQSIKIANNILSKRKLPINILEKPQGNLEQHQSIEIKVKKMTVGCQEYHKWINYRQQKIKSQKERLVAIGGPACTDQALIASLIPGIRQKCQVIFYTRNYLQSSVLHSTWQANARRAPALNTKKSITGRALFPVILKRRIFGQTLEEMTKLSYQTFNVKVPNLRTAYAYLRIQINGIIQSAMRIYKPKQLNEFDVCRMDAVASRQIQRIIQKQIGQNINGQYFLNYLKKQNHDKCMNIDLISDQAGFKVAHSDWKQYQKVTGLQHQMIQQQKLRQYFPPAFKEGNKSIFYGVRYIGDFSNNVDLYYVAKQKAERLGAKWYQNKTAKQIYVSNHIDPNRASLCGVKFSDGQFVPMDKMHMSLGYKSIFRYQDGSQCLNSYSVPATGISCNLILHRNQAINKIMSQSGQFDISFSQIHLSVIGYDSQYVLVRAAIGANVGSQAYCPQHFINLISTTKRLFGQAFVGVVSAYGCIRAVNFKNTTQFAKIADGLIISYGKGGTGSKKRSSEAYKALVYLGYGKHLDKHFDGIVEQQQIEQQKGSEYEQQKKLRISFLINKICLESKKWGFYYEHQKQTFDKLFK